MLNATENYHIIPTDSSSRGVSYIFGYGNRPARIARSRVRPLRLSRVSYFRRRTLHESRYLASRRNDFLTWMHRYVLANWPNFPASIPQNDRLTTVRTNIVDPPANHR